VTGAGSNERIGSTTSVVIAAHNEETVIGACLDALLADARPGELDITVVPNGCTDATATQARRRPGVRVVETAAAGKAPALNAGDAAAQGFPRIYLDADIVVSTDVVRALRDRLHGDTAAIVAFPGRRIEMAGRPWPVRCYFAVNNRLPVFRDGLFGRGMVALSELARRRFDDFPDLVADDLFLDSLFSAEERALVDAVSTTVEAPLRTRDLVNRLVRVRRGNAALRTAGASGQLGPYVRQADRWSWLRDVVLPRPWLAPAGVVYVAITVVAAVRARRSRGQQGWERDTSTRTAPAPGGVS
jgi:glycosyltransferase involved in cell wall biosynthesis